MPETLAGRLKTRASLDNVNVDAEGDLQVDVKSMPPVSVSVTEKGFSDSADVPTRALVDADRHVQVDVIGFPEALVNIAKVSGTVQTARDWSLDLAKLQNVDVLLSSRASESTLSSILGKLDIALSALRDALKQSTIDTTVYTKSLADVWYQLTQTLAVHEQTPWNPPNLDVALSTRASESTLAAIKAALASVGMDKLRVSVVDALPSGTNTIGNVNAIKSGTWNIDNLLNPHPIQVNREGTVKHFSVAVTAAGSTTIYTPSTGKAVQVLGWSFMCDADVTCLLRFTTSGNVIAGLPAKGAHAMNLLGLNPPQGAVGETVEIYVGGAANVKGWISVKEV